MSTDTSPLGPGRIRFHRAAPPALPAGRYELQVTQRLRAWRGPPGDEKTLAATEFHSLARFVVAGPRFQLDPDDVYSVHPPAGQSGSFANALPHVVFTRRTLPWERTIDGAAQDPDAPVPWLALLVIGHDDFDGADLPAVTPRRIGELLHPEDPVQGPEGIDPAAEGQHEGELCNTIDLDAGLFATIAPTLGELPLLAHVREVDTGGKETLSLRQDGWFTVVLANRLPVTVPSSDPQPGDEPPVGATSRACLVSLEGWGRWLPRVGDDGRAAVALPPGKTRVRLAVLASWEFVCHGDQDFKARMAALDDQRPLGLPVDGLCGDDEGTQAVRQAFERGYVALDHTTRLGEKTVSWYRGPLVPQRIPPRAPYAFVGCADQALRYDPRDGLFAAEYAAAFELGRMLALHDRGFARAMQRHRQRIRQAIAAQDRDERSERALGIPLPWRGRRGEPDPLTVHAPWHAAGTLEDAVRALFDDGDRGGAYSSDRPPAGLPLEPPAEVQRFLARAVLLYGVPFHYLVPDERMLDTESIRFFHLDPGWIATLIQGATSVGRVGERDSALDTWLRHHALDRAMGDAARVRERGAACHEPGAEKAEWPLTGFLLRSALVDGWQGLAMRAADADGRELAPLRIDRLAPDILLCIFNGEVATLTVEQPQEGLHFGLTPRSDGGYERLSLRAVGGPDDDVAPGEQIPARGDGPIQVPMREAAPGRTRPTRVVRLEALAQAIGQALARRGCPVAEITSAELAVQLVESPGRVTFEAAGPGAS